MKTRFIVNLRSGRAARALPAVQEFALHRGAAVVFTERPRHARELAARALAEGCDLIVAVGGDGTMNEVASSLVDTPAILGLVPSGSGDGLGRHLGIHGSVAHALRILETGTPRPIDSGLADGHPFFTLAGLGFEAEIAQRFNALQHRGFLRYLTTSARAFRLWQPQRYRIHCDGHIEERLAFTLAVANSDQYGNNAIVAPGARADDGQLDLCAIPPVNLLNAAPLLARLFRGTLAHDRRVLFRRGTRFTVERDAPGPLHTDGETYEAGRIVDFSIRPASLRIMTPGR
ncbi:MAG TPA: diacylglycerol kinase family protein [Opitutus sp.]|nr:diacylglycerol kinase family protein [Opitutus sp.]